MTWSVVATSNVTVDSQVGEHPDYKSFRIGLFGLDKLTDIDRTVRLFIESLDGCPSLH